MAVQALGAVQRVRGSLRRAPAGPSSLPARGTPESLLLDGRITAVLSGSGGLLMLALAPLVPASSAMAAAGLLALVLCAWAWGTPVSAPSWVRSAYTASAAPVITLGTYAAEHQTPLRLGAVALLCPVVVIACLRPWREVAWQVGWAQAVYGAYLLLTVPASSAVVGVAASGTIMVMLTALLCWLRSRLDGVLDDLRRQAGTDPLTGLRNRSGLRSAVRPGPAEGGLLLLDLDHFKDVNDRHGHEVGDTVLVWFAGLLRDAMRAGDVVSRHGGEEFVVYLPLLDDPHDLHARAEGVRRRVQREADARGLPLTVSIGGACGALDLDALLRAADAELYAAKRSGRNAVRTAGVPVAPEPVV